MDRTTSISKNIYNIYRKPLRLSSLSSSFLSISLLRKARWERNMKHIDSDTTLNMVQIM